MALSYDEGTGQLYVGDSARPVVVLSAVYTSTIFLKDHTLSPEPVQEGHCAVSIKCRMSLYGTTRPCMVLPWVTDIATVGVCCQHFYSFLFIRTWLRFRNNGSWYDGLRVCAGLRHWSQHRISAKNLKGKRCRWHLFSSVSVWCGVCVSVLD